MAQQYPETEPSAESMEGDASHEIGAIIIEAAQIGVTRNMDFFIGKTATNGVLFTEEMYDAARIYADDVITIMRKYAIFGGEQIGVESKLTAPYIHELSHGTIDSFIFPRRDRHLYLWDYKYGYGIHEAFENWQLINYLAGLVERFKIDGIEDQNITVHMRIAQPRAFHRDGSIREWTVNLAEMRGYINVLRSNAHKALSNDSVTRTGEHCRHCQARHVCAAALTGGMQLYEVATAPTPLDMSLTAIGIQHAIITRAKKQLDYLESGYMEQVKTLMRTGSNVPGWMVEQGYGRERWAKPPAEIIQLGKLMGYDFSKPDAAITPNQARKICNDDALIKTYSETPRAGLKIVPDNCSKAKQVFKP